MGDLYTKPQAKAGSIDRGLSPNLWNQAPLQQVLGGGLGEGFGFIDDFLTVHPTLGEGPWVGTQYGSAGALVETAGKGGVITLDSASASDDKGVQIQYGGAAAVSSFIPNANAKIYYETRLKVVDITSGSDVDGIDLFVGLAAALTTIINANANTSPNHIGFEHLESLAGSVSFVSEKAGSRATETGVDTLVDGTFVKLGFIVDGLTSITPYVNGVAGTAITTNVPIVEMTPSFVSQSNALAVDPITHVDWVACIQAEDIAN